MKHLAIYRRCLSRCFALLALPAVLGCSLLVEAERKVCSTDLDCQNRGPEFAASLCVDSYCRTDPKWACAELPATTQTQSAVQASITVMNMVDFAGLAGVHISLCGTLDLQCLTPLAESDTDATGVALVNVPQSFGGYAMVESTAIEPYLFFPNFPVEDGNSLGTVVVSPKGGLQSLASQLGDIVMSGRGLIVAQVLDCQQQYMVGASVEWVGNMTGSHPYYALNGIPSGTATVTDSTGVAGLLNALPGTMGVTAKFGGRTVGQVSVLVRDGYVSFRAIQLGDLI